MPPDPFEILRVELVEALAPIVNRVIESGEGEVTPALYQLAYIRTTLAKVAGIDDFLLISTRQSGCCERTC